MVLQASGIIDISDISAEFTGGSGDLPLSDYYRGGSFVPDHGNTTGIPPSGIIALSDFYGTARLPPDFTATITAGSRTISTSPRGPNNIARGYDGGPDRKTLASYGSITADSFTDAGGNARVASSIAVSSLLDVHWLSLNVTGVPNVNDTFLDMVWDDGGPDEVTKTRASAFYFPSIDGGSHWDWQFFPAAVGSGVWSIRLIW